MLPQKFISSIWYARRPAANRHDPRAAVYPLQLGCSSWCGFLQLVVSGRGSRAADFFDLTCVIIPLDIRVSLRLLPSCVDELLQQVDAGDPPLDNDDIILARRANSSYRIRSCACSAQVVAARFLHVLYCVDRKLPAAKLSICMHGRRLESLRPYKLNLLLHGWEPELDLPRSADLRTLG